MATIILVIHLMIAVALVAVVLLQRSEGGALGIGGGGGGGFMSGRGVGSALTRATAILAAAFFVTSLALGIIAARGGKSSILDGLAPAPSTSGITVPAPLAVPQADQSAPAAPGATPAPASAAPTTTPAAPATPSTPVVPRAE